jgi:hypothetical protein
MMEALAVFPCRFDKTPAVAGGFKSATNDPAVVELWRKRWMLMGAPTGGVNGFDVLDVDRGGEDWLALYEATHGFPRTRVVATRSGGLHVYFQHRAGVMCSAGLLAPNVDIRGEGGYVILWDWAGCRVLFEGPVAPWPGPMIQLLHEAMEAGRRTPQLFSASPVAIVRTADDRSVPKPLYDKIIELMRGAPRLNQRRVRGVLRPLVFAHDGRNWALYEAALQFRELIPAKIIDREGAERLLFMAAQLNGYVAKRGEDFARRTIKSGLDSRPRTTREAQNFFFGEGEWPE